MVEKVNNNTMEKYYFKANWSEPGGLCMEKCHVHNNGIMIGSLACIQCRFHEENDLDVDNDFSMSWLKCSKLSEARGEFQNE